MRFNQDTGGGNGIRFYSDQGIVINDRLISTSVLVTAGQIEAWPPGSFADLEERHLELLVAHQPGIIILGTGKTIAFPAPRLLAGIQRRGIGIEVMANDAAIRTFNVLLSEDRKVLLALLQG
ncbi:MAG TPA: Mth938-like domain-containing protein [Gammaproteobacteria bacterium]|nr:Mth938-like domain-containing protein [Gammaproteobacteria bacterium]